MQEVVVEVGRDIVLMHLGGLGLRLIDIGERLVVLLDVLPRGVVHEAVRTGGTLPVFCGGLLEELIKLAGRALHPDKRLHGRFPRAEQMRHIRTKCVRRGNLFRQVELSGLLPLY